MDAAALMIEVTLTAELDVLAQAPVGERTVQAVRMALENVSDSLGIPGGVSVSLAVRSEASQQPWLELNVGGRKCRYPGTLPARVRSYVTTQPLAPDPTAEQTLAWLVGAVSSDSEAMLDQVIEFMALACAEIVKLQPECLFDAAQARTFAAAMPPVEGMPDSQRDMAADPGWLRALGKVLSLGISIGNRGRVSEVVAAGLADGRSWGQIAEDLIDALAPDCIEVRMPRDHLRMLTSMQPATAGGHESALPASSSGSHDTLFPLMRDGLFYGLGWRFPDFRWVCDETLNPGTFAFRLNHLVMLPYVGLRASQCLTNDTVARLALLNISASATTHPPNGGEASIFEAAHRTTVELAHRTTWDPFGYLILCLSTDLRAASPRFVLRRTVRHVLQQLDSTIPALIRTVHGKFALEQITGVLRELLAEQVAVRNVRLILECLCDFDYIVADAQRHIIFDDRLPVSRAPHPVWLAEPVQIAAAVRSGLKRQLSHQHTRGANALIVYLLDPEIERAIARGIRPDAPPGDAPPLTGADQERLLAALREELRSTGREVNRPAILTTQDLRPAVRQVLAHEFPTLPVLAYQELSPDMNIQPIARIAWSELEMR